MNPQAYKLLLQIGFLVGGISLLMLLFIPPEEPEFVISVLNVCVGAALIGVGSFFIRRA